MSERMNPPGNAFKLNETILSTPNTGILDWHSGRVPHTASAGHTYFSRRRWNWSMVEQMKAL